MDLSKNVRILKDIIARSGEIGIKSTGASLINYTGNLYNVDGSSDDPNIDGRNWKNLLTSHGINSPCYVSNSTPNNNSHPGFNVGGHMTQNSDGHVLVGADSYLMPLCSWHNHTSRNGVAFTHEKTLMLRLSGYMQDEFVASFIARLPSEERFALIYRDNEEWKSLNLVDQQATDTKSGNLPEALLLCRPDQYVLLERVARNNGQYYIVNKSKLEV